MHLIAPYFKDNRINYEITCLKMNYYRSFTHKYIQFTLLQ